MLPLRLIAITALTSGLLHAANPNVIVILTDDMGWGELHHYRANFALNGSNLKPEGEAIAMIAAIDDGVGKIVQKLRHHEIDRNTLIMFTSDNGAPLKITKPDSPVSSLDFAATANAAAGLATAAELDGVNLAPFLTGQNPAAPHAQLCWRFWNQAAIREGRWKYLTAGGTGVLFDLETDAHEGNNLIQEQPERAATLRSKPAEWTAQFKPPGIPAKPRNDQESRWYEHYFPHQNHDPQKPSGRHHGAWTRRMF